MTLNEQLIELDKLYPSKTKIPVVPKNIADDLVNFMVEDAKFIDEPVCPTAVATVSVQNPKKYVRHKFDADDLINSMI